VIKLLHPVVGLIAGLLVGALLVMINKPALLRLVEAEAPPPVLFVVVVKRAFLQVVALGVARAGYCLKQIQIQKRHALHHRQVLGAVVAVLPLAVIGQLRLKVGDGPARYLLVVLLLRSYILARGRGGVVDVLESFRVCHVARGVLPTIVVVILYEGLLLRDDIVRAFSHVEVVLV